MVENLSMPDLLKDVILIYFFCRAQPNFSFSGIVISLNFTAEHTEIFIMNDFVLLRMRTVRNTSRSNWCPKPRHFNAFVTCVDATHSYLSGGLIIKPIPSRSRRAITRGGAV